MLAGSVDIELQRNRLLDLIDYVEATERDRLKVIFDFRDHAGFRATEAELADLPGVSLDCGVEGDPIWGCASNDWERSLRLRLPTLN